MQERIILAPGCNGTELLRSLAMHNVKDLFNVRIVNATELAQIALMRAGVVVDEDIIDFKEESLIVRQAVSSVGYFEKTSYKDIQDITNALRKLRKMVATKEKENLQFALFKGDLKACKDTSSVGVFRKKNIALYDVYSEYMELLGCNKIDTIGLIRKVLDNPSNLCFNGEFITLEEYPLMPIEEALINKISGNKVKQSNLFDLYGVEQNSINIKSYKNCYGAPNEVEMILDDIYSDKKLDECIVAVADVGTYSQIFYDYVLLYNIPVTFGTGIPITNSNPAELLRLYFEWAGGKFFNKAALKVMFESNAFNNFQLRQNFPEVTIKPEWKHFWSNFWDNLYTLCLTNNHSENEIKISNYEHAVEAEKEAVKGNSRDYNNACAKVASIPLIRAVAEELELTPDIFIKKYAYIRKTNDLTVRLDNKALSTICEELEYAKNCKDIDIEDIVTTILELRVLKQSRDAGKLHITTIEDAKSSFRKYLYIAGLSAKNYPGAPKENYLILDGDLIGKIENSASGEDRVVEFFENGIKETSTAKVEFRYNQFIQMIKLATSLNVEVTISFAGLNVSDLKQQNKSSLLYELYRLQHGKDVSYQEMEAAVHGVKYFKPRISLSRGIGQAYNENKRILPNDNSIKPNKFKCEYEGHDYSPSAMDLFFACPRRFMLRYVLGIQEPEEENIFEIISASEKGSLAHSLIERLANTDIPVDEFIKLASEYFEWFIKQKPAMVPETVDLEKKRFLDMMTIAYNMNSNREVVLQEKEIACEINGVSIKGYPDRVEKVGNDEYIVVDFKSGSNVKHIEDDPVTCRQILFYAYILKHANNFNIVGCEYRYIALGEVITCKFDKDMEEALVKQMEQFKNAMDNGDFPVSECDDGEEPCKYCKLKSVCGKMIEGDESDD